MELKQWVFGSILVDLNIFSRPFLGLKSVINVPNFAVDQVSEEDNDNNEN